MQIKDSKKLGYELGVLMFNVVLEHEDALIFNNGYDGIENFVHIIMSINIDLDELKEGFIAECENYNISNEKAVELFKQAKETINNYSD